jgi:hypothetical protein
MNNEWEDVPVNVKFKISALWIVTLFIFAYVDIFLFYKLGFIEDLMRGRVANFNIDESFLLLTTLYISIPSFMVFVSLVAPVKANRRLNFWVCSFYIITILLSLIGENSLFYIFGSVVESLLLLSIIRYALKWPRQTLQPVC